MAEVHNLFVSESIFFSCFFDRPQTAVAGQYFRRDLTVRLTFSVNGMSTKRGLALLEVNIGWDWKTFTD